MRIRLIGLGGYLIRVEDTAGQLVAESSELLSETGHPIDIEDSTDLNGNTIVTATFWDDPGVAASSGNNMTGQGASGFPTTDEEGLNYRCVPGFIDDKGSFRAEVSKCKAVPDRDEVTCTSTIISGTIGYCKRGYNLLFPPSCYIRPNVTHYGSVYSIDTAAKIISCGSSSTGVSVNVGIGWGPVSLGGSASSGSTTQEYQWYCDYVRTSSNYPLNFQDCVGTP